jgi:uncharacterized membrane protein YfhO
MINVSNNIIPNIFFLTYFQDKDPNHLQIQAEITQDGYLIRKENFHTGWRAKVNNIDTPIIKYADVFQAIKVNKGKTIIDFKFDSLYPVLMWLHIIFVFFRYLVTRKNNFKNIKEF